MLSVEHVSKQFGSLRAVDDVTLTVKANTITGLIGPNGAGKTTLFNTIVGSLPVDQGTIRVHGERIDGLTTDRIYGKGLARTFQIPRPFPEMTVLENVMLARPHQSGERFWNSLFRYGLVRREEQENQNLAQGVLNFCGLERVTNDLAKTLSGGQQKLLELARVLMAKPAMILLDEPAAGVNPALLETLIEKILELHRGGITFMIIEHNMDMVMSICRPIAVMAQGRLIAEGDPDTIRTDPRVVDAYLGNIPG
ncbi:MAG: ABC transporter ATP-binding protein [Alphaproteobacteria bacterium]|nr:ABC transporter ATP-binding protein [Alphaproteobacteria bacterium]